MQTEITIVGGGMVGLSLALMLARMNVCERITVCDEQALAHSAFEHYQPSFDDRSTAISAGSLRLLKQLDLWSAIAPQAQCIECVKVSDQGHLGSSEYKRSENHDQSLGFVVENRWLGLQLKAAIDQEESIEVLAPASVKAATPKQGGVELEFEDPVSRQAGGNRIATLHTSLLVLADGAKSNLAKGLGVGFTQHDYNQHALIVNVAHSQDHAGQAFEHFTEKGPLAFLPLRNVGGLNRSAVVWTHANDRISDVLNCDEDIFAKRLEIEFSKRLGSITQVGKRLAYPLSLIRAEEQVRRNLVLVGNAAHFLHPVAGQGFNLSLRDCAVLVESLRKGLQQGRALADFSDLQDYVLAREIDQRWTTELSHNFISLFTSRDRLKRILRTSGLSALNQVPMAKSFFFRQMMGLGLNEVSLR